MVSIVHPTNIDTARGYATSGIINYGEGGVEIWVTKGCIRGFFFSLLFKHVLWP